MYQHVLGACEAGASLRENLHQLRRRARTPGFVRRHAKLAVDGPVFETWRLGYLIDTIYLRDSARGLLTTVVPF